MPGLRSPCGLHACGLPGRGRVPGVTNVRVGTWGLLVCEGDEGGAASVPWVCGVGVGGGMGFGLGSLTEGDGEYPE